MATTGDGATPVDTAGGDANGNAGQRTARRRRQSSVQASRMYSSRSLVDEGAQPDLQLPPYLWLPDSVGRILWDSVVLLPILYTATVMPYRLFFVPGKDTEGWEVVERIVWVIFLIDMPVQFNTAYIRGDRLVISRRRVAKHYLRTFFFLDLIACIPFDAFLEDDDQDAEANQLSRFSRIPRALRLIRLIRLVRVVRLLNLRRYARRIETLFALNPSILRLGRTLAAALFMLHIVAGMWNYTALLDDPDNPDVWVNQRGIADAEPELRYLVSVYWALTTMTSVGYGDIGATTPAEMLVAILVQLIGLVWAGWVVANLMSIMGRIDAKEEVRNQRHQQINALIRSGGVPRKLRRQMSAWVDTAPLPAARNEEVLSKMPDALRRPVLLAVHSKNIREIHVLSAMLEKDENIVADLVQEFMVLYADTSAFLFIEEAPVDEFYLLLQGSVVLSSGHRDVHTATSGDHIGDFDLFFSATHTVSAQASDDVTGFSVKASSMKELCRRYGMLGRYLRRSSSMLLEQIFKALGGSHDRPEHASVMQTLERARKSMRSTDGEMRRGAASLSSARGGARASIAHDAIALAVLSGQRAMDVSSESSDSDLVSSSDSETELAVELVRHQTRTGASKRRQSKGGVVSTLQERLSPSARRTPPSAKEAPGAAAIGAVAKSGERVRDAEEPESKTDATASSGAGDAAPAEDASPSVASEGDLVVDDAPRGGDTV